MCMKDRQTAWFLILPLIVFMCWRARRQQTGSALAWHSLTPLPDPKGVAGAFAGVSGGALLVGGGANFLTTPPWSGGVKTYHDSVYALESPQSGAWRLVGRLPRPLAYGVSVSWRGRLLCVGGSDSVVHHAGTFALRYRIAGGGYLDQEAGPNAPVALANAAGILIGDALYVAGGSVSPTSDEALHRLWRLDLSSGLASAEWRELPPWPGPGRILPAIGWDGRSLLLVSGAALSRAAEGSPTERRYLTDAYAYDVHTRRWVVLPPPPRPLVAAPTPGIRLSAERRHRDDETDEGVCLHPARSDYLRARALAPTDDHVLLQHHISLLAIYRHGRQVHMYCSCQAMMERTLPSRRAPASSPYPRLALFAYSPRAAP